MYSDSVGYKMLKRALPWMILLLGIVLRVYEFASVPGGYHRDEAYGAWNALSLYKDGIDSAGHSFPVYFEAWAHGQNALNSYLMLPLLAISGGNMNLWVVRLPQVILAIFTLVAVYFLMKRMFSDKLGIWALFLLAICPWHVMMSRWGLESNLAPGFLILGLMFWILGMDNAKLLPLSALCYGLSLYCYATIWPIVPVMILLQFIYSIWTKKIKISRYLFLSVAILLALATPLVLFLLVNMDVLPEMKIGCFSIYRMTEFRSGELAHSFSQIFRNIRHLGYLLKNQDIGRPYDVIMPYGFFYDIGRVFIIIGVMAVVWRSCKAIYKKTFAYEIFILIQLIGAAIVGALVTVSMTQINCLYIPLVLCEAVGVVTTCEFVAKIFEKISKKEIGKYVKFVAGSIITVVFLVQLTGFQREYYTDYKVLVSANFQEGADTAVQYAWQKGQEMELDVSVNAGLKYPNVLLATGTGAREYLDTLVYSEYLPAPSQFSCDGVVFYMGIDYEEIQRDRIYVLYYTDIEMFSDFELRQFFDWYVAVPKLN